MKVPPFMNDGKMSSESQLYNDTLNAQMQENLSDDGIVMPPQTTDTIDNLATKMADGVVWYDTTLKKYKGKEDGVVVIFNTTPA